MYELEVMDRVLLMIMLQIMIVFPSTHCRRNGRAGAPPKKVYHLVRNQQVYHLLSTSNTERLEIDSNPPYKGSSKHPHLTKNILAVLSDVRLSSFLLFVLEFI